jgi:hypothetical protein
VIGSLKTFCEAVSGMGAREGAASLSRCRVPAGGAKLISSLPGDFPKAQPIEPLSNSHT